MYFRKPSKIKAYSLDINATHSTWHEPLGLMSWAHFHTLRYFDRSFLYVLSISSAPIGAVMIMDATAAVKMTEELAGVMARTCSPDLKNIDPTVICRRNGW